MTKAKHTPKRFIVNGDWDDAGDAERDVLLAALYSAECVVEDFCTGQAPKNQCWAVLDEINAAIAKATGEAK